MLRPSEDATQLVASESVGEVGVRVCSSVVCKSLETDEHGNTNRASSPIEANSGGGLRSSVPGMEANDSTDGAEVDAVNAGEVVTNVVFGDIAAVVVVGGGADE